MWADVPSARALFQAGAGQSGRDTDEIDSDDVAAVDSGETPVIAVTEVLEAEFDAGSHLGEGMLLKNLRSSVKIEDVKLWRYLYGIPLSVEIRVLTTMSELTGSCLAGWQYTS